MNLVSNHPFHINLPLPDDKEAAAIYDYFSSLNMVGFAIITMPSPIAHVTNFS